MLWFKCIGIGHMPHLKAEKQPVRKKYVVLINLLLFLYAGCYYNDLQNAFLLKISQWICCNNVNGKD